MLRAYAFLVLIVALMVAVVVLGGHGGTAAKGALLPPSLAVDRIAYVDLDRQVRTVAPDGTGEVRVTSEEGFFAWPTWSPDGRRMVFSGVVEGEDGPKVSLYSYNAFLGQRRPLHERDPGLSAVVAYNAPHYPFWSPDGTRLAFIGNTEEGLTLYLDDLRDGDGPIAVLDNGPLWMDWSPDSRYLFVHRREDHVVLDTDSGVTSTLAIRYSGPGYNTPAWRPLGEEITYVAGDFAGGYRLYTAGLDGRGETEVAEVSRDSAFLWSPDGESLAVTRGSPSRVFYPPAVLRVYGHVSFYSSDGSLQPVDIRDDVVAFFWSPDGRKLAYLTLNGAPGVLRWNVLDVANGSRWPLVDFIPSDDQLTVVQFFDQYAHSHSVWSPDSTSLVFAGRTPGQAASASSRLQPADHIFVVTTIPLPSAYVVADGYLGFWSPR